MSKRTDPPKVYMATFPGGKKYIGITTATMNIRKSEHYSRAKKDPRHAVHNALNKYGQNVNWEVLRICSSYEEAKEFEIKFIKELNTMAPNGYNLTAGGNGTKGIKITEEHRKNLSNSHKGYVMPETQKLAIKLANMGKKGTTNVSVEIYEKSTGNFVGKWDSLTECAKDLNVKIASICHNINGRTKSFSKYVAKRAQHVI